MTTYFNAEWRVNGLWNALLSHYYPPMFGTTGFVSCPEAFAGIADTQGFQADLAIRQMTLDAGTGTWKMSLPLVVFEGKGGTVSTTWDAIRDQLHTWCNKGDGGLKFNLWAIAAWGSMVTFYYYHHDGANNVMQAVAWQNGLVPNKEQHLDLTKDNDWDAIQNILAYAKANP